MEFSHSEISGSKLASSSPKLIAGNHVLHRLVVPRHPSYALKYLTILCSTQINFCKPFEFLLYDHLTLLLPHIEYVANIFDALFINLSKLLYENISGKMFSLPIFVVKLHLIISMTWWFRFCLNR